MIASTGTLTSRFGYGGAFGYQEEDSGLKLLGHRFYDPNAGRFLTRDRIKDGRNWYAYCDNNPIKRADPSGLSGQDLAADLARLEAKGLVPSGTTFRYRTDPSFRERVRRALESGKENSGRPGGENSTDEEIADAVEQAESKQDSHRNERPRRGKKSDYRNPFENGAKKGSPASRRGSTGTGQSGKSSKAPARPTGGSGPLIDTDTAVRGLIIVGGILIIICFPEMAPVALPAVKHALAGG